MGKICLSFIITAEDFRIHTFVLIYGRNFDNFTRVMKHIKWGFVLKQLKAEFMLKWDAAQPEIYLSLWPS